MRWLLVMFVLASTTASAKPSNPAFLGIAMHDLPTRPGGPAGPCIVDNVTRGSGAQHAGLRSDDVLMTIDAVAIPNCDAVLRAVTAHEPGDQVKIGILRFGKTPMTIAAVLISRDEILRRRHVGQPLAPTEVIGVDDAKSIDLSEQHGKTTIVGWFDVRRCDGCASVFAKIAAWSRTQAGRPGAQPQTIAVTRGDEAELKSYRSISLDVPLTVAEDALYESFTIADSERIHLMVVDCRGVVQFVSPIAPNSDDTDAVLDELYAAVEQASRRASK